MVGSAVIVIVCVEFVAMLFGVTDNQLWPAGVVAELGVNETTVGATGAVKEIDWDSGVVEPCCAEGVQDVRLGVTAGGAVPVATMVAFARLNIVVVGGVPDSTAVTVAETRFT